MLVHLLVRHVVQDTSPRHIGCHYPLSCLFQSMRTSNFLDRIKQTTKFDESSSLSSFLLRVQANAGNLCSCFLATHIFAPSIFSSQDDKWSGGVHLKRHASEHALMASRPVHKIHCSDSQYRCLGRLDRRSSAAME